MLDRRYSVHLFDIHMRKFNAPSPTPLQKGFAAQSEKDQRRILIVQLRNTLRGIRQRRNNPALTDAGRRGLDARVAEYAALVARCALYDQRVWTMLGIRLGHIPADHRTRRAVHQMTMRDRRQHRERAAREAVQEPWDQRIQREDKHHG